MYADLAILALLAFFYSLISGRVEKLPISGPIVFVVAGLLLGPLGIGWLTDDVTDGQFRVLVDLTLSLILFSDAASANFSVLRRQWQLPTRLLVIGLPGAMALGFVTAAWLFDALTTFEAALLGVMLAATDAALGKAVVTNEVVPARLREGLNCESGLNDGLCVPFLLLFIALALGHDGELPVLLVVEELGIGALVGAIVAGTGAWLLRFCEARGWVSPIWLQTAVPGLAFACFAIAQTLHGSGYIAAFVGGMFFGSYLKEQLHSLVMPAEGIGETMAMLTWVIFGAFAIKESIDFVTWEILLYVLLSLTVVRMLPVYLALWGSGERPSGKLFLGWFGPRGLASIVFTIMVAGENLPGGQLITVVVTCSVLLSLIAHGITANPLAAWIARKEEGGLP